jgi:putative (di)nucleoside polyphosphate hydrolase
MNETEIKYKANVAAILRNARGRILICERLGVKDAWQFPQGGIDEGETPEQALVRELGEEVGVDAGDIRIVERRGPYRYLYGNGRIKRGHHGKEQLYFLCDFAGDDTRINVETKHPEFQDFRWIEPADFRLDWLPEMKRAVYRTVFDDFFGVKINARP